MVPLKTLWSLWETKLGKLMELQLRTGSSPHGLCLGHMVRPVCCTTQGLPGADSAVHGTFWKGAL